MKEKLSKTATDIIRALYFDFSNGKRDKLTLGDINNAVYKITKKKLKSFRAVKEIAEQ